MNPFIKLVYTRELTYFLDDKTQLTLATHINSKGEKSNTIKINGAEIHEKYEDGAFIITTPQYNHILEQYEEQISEAYLFARIADTGNVHIPAIPGGKYTYYVRLCGYDCYHNIYFYSACEDYLQINNNSTVLINKEEHYQMNEDFIVYIEDNVSNTIKSDYDILNKKGDLILPYHILTKQPDVAQMGDKILGYSHKLKSILTSNKTNIENYVTEYNSPKNKKR